MIAAAEPVWYGYAVGFAIAFSPTALALVASAALSKRSKEEWRLLAWVPPLPLVYWWIILFIAMVRRPNANTMWPLEMLLYVGLTAVLFVVFLVGRKVATSGAPPRPWQH